MVVLSECDHHRHHHHHHHHHQQQHDGGGGGGDAAVEGSTGSVIDSASNKAQRASTYAAGKEWCQKLELEPPTKLSALRSKKRKKWNAAGVANTQKFFEQVVVCGLAPETCRPVSPERTWEDQKRRAWLYSSIALGVAVAVGAAVMVRKTLSSRKLTEDSGSN